MNKIILYLTAVIFLISCGSKSSSLNYSGTDMVDCEEIVKPEKQISQDGIDLKNAIEKKIIKNGMLTVEVKEIKSEKLRIDSLIRKVGAYYDKETLNNDNNSISYNLIIRIPSNKFDYFINAVEHGNNEVKYKEIAAEDVTETFIDLETRLANKRKFMERYQNLLKSAKSVKEILEIQENIRALEEEIESTTGRLKYLNNQVNLSTMELNITQDKDFKYVPDKRDKASEKFKQSIIGGWFVFVDFIYILLYNWAFLILLSAGIYVFIRIRRKRKTFKKKE